MATPLVAETAFAQAVGGAQTPRVAAPGLSAAPVAPAAPAPPAPSNPPVAPTPVAPPSASAPPAFPSAPVQVAPETAPTANPRPPPVPIAPPPLPAATPAASSEDTEDHGSWYEALDVSAFIDGYYSLNFNLPKPQNDQNRFHAFDRDNGFALSWAGLDIGYQSDSVGATVNLRVGPSARILAGDDATHGLEFLKQGFATWRPWGSESRLSFDFGKFDSIYGVESADSQKNANYTRGLLYTLAQPHFHTGLRATYSITDSFSVTGLVINGWNDSVDNNFGKSFGAQLAYSAPRADGSGNLVVAKLGYVAGPEQSDVYYADCPTGTAYSLLPSPACRAGAAGPSSFPVDRGKGNSVGVRQLLDLAVLFDPSEAESFALNVDYGRDERLDQGVTTVTSTAVEWFGISVSGRYRFSDVWALAARGEYLDDDKAYLCDLNEKEPNGSSPGTIGACGARGITKLALYSGTLTGEAAVADHLILRLEGRLDHSTKDIFPVLRTVKPDQGTVTFGVVATTN